MNNFQELPKQMANQHFSVYQLTQRQNYIHCGPCVFFAANCNGAFVGIDDFITHHETEAGTPFLGGIKRLAQPGDSILWDPNSLINYANDDLIVPCMLQFDSEYPSIRHCFDPVLFFSLVQTDQHKIEW
jgi:hypothetical protein